MNILLVGGGFALLLIGGEILVRGASSLALRLGMSPLLIGLTVVAFGTSAPELVVSVDAALNDSPGIAIGNVVGSNIANILLILAVGALIRPVPAYASSVLRDGGMVLVATCLIAAIAWSGIFEWWHGALMVPALVLYLIFSYRGDSAPQIPLQEDALVQPLWLTIVFILAGLVGLVFGAEWLVTGAVDIASTMGVSDEIIGVTLVAIGTSLPELAIVIAAARKGQTDMVFGNVVGSNIFNCFGILGVTALVAPIPVDISAIGFDLVVMVTVTVLLLPLAASDRRMSRREGAVLLSLFAGFIAINYIGKPVLTGF